MPIYTFQCINGHRTEIIRPIGTETTGCLDCREDAWRVFEPTQFAHTSGLPTDFKPGPDFYRLNSEAIAAKKEARKELHDAVMNGWKGKTNG